MNSNNMMGSNPASNNECNANISNKNYPVWHGHAYYRYILPERILCTQEFRQALMDIGCINVTPSKCGLGRRYHQSGVLEFHSGQTFSLPFQIEIRSTLINFEKISYEEYNILKQKQALKIFFKGFHMKASKADVRSIFSIFGPIEYIYFMVDPNPGNSTTRLGYLIYSDRESVENLFAAGPYLSCQGYPIKYAEYKGQNQRAGNTRKLKPRKPRAPKNVPDNSGSQNIFNNAELPASLAWGETPKQNRIGSQCDQAFLSEIRENSKCKRLHLKALDNVKINIATANNIRFNVYPFSFSRFTSLYQAKHQP